MLMQISQQGLDENKHFAHNYWDDMVCRLVGWEHLVIPRLEVDRIVYKVEGVFWDYWLEHRFASAGYNSKKPSECWSRSLGDALKDSKDLSKKLFSPSVRAFPAPWFEPIEAAEPGLSKIEDLYKRHLPAGYKGLGRAIARRNDPNPEKTIQECCEWLDAQARKVA